MAKSFTDGPDDNSQSNEFITPSWRKSKHSIGNGQCAEAAIYNDGRLAVRDSVDMSGPVLLFTQAKWQNFVEQIKDGDFDGI